MRMKDSWLVVVFVIVFGHNTAALAQSRASDKEWAAIVEGAKKEGKVVVYSTTDAKLASPLIKDFEAAFPGVKVEYTDLNSTEVYNRFISENAANATSADAVWSSSMDLQMKLAADGAAATYKSPETAALPGWATLDQGGEHTRLRPRRRPDGSHPRLRTASLRRNSEDHDGSSRADVYVD